ncbi:MAG: hypothetical protein EBT22_07205 [Chloroflexi bacterium]|nr:hypothetical protein [Chloroflexota bacterium]
MAHKKGVGSSRNGRDSNPKYLGVKRYDGEAVLAGSIPGSAGWGGLMPCPRAWAASSSGRAQHSHC